MQSFLRRNETVFRFAAASATVMALVIGLITLGEPRGLSLASLGAAALEVAAMTAGYAVSLAWLPRRAGHRPLPSSWHAMAGVLAPIALGALSTQVQGVSLAGVAALSLAVGSCLGIVQWLRTLRTPRPPHPTLEEREAAADKALAEAVAAAALHRDVLPLHQPARVSEPPMEQVA